MYSIIFGRKRGGEEDHGLFCPSGIKTQKKEIMPYPRCGFGACLRCG